MKRKNTWVKTLPILLAILAIFTSSCSKEKVGLPSKTYVSFLDPLNSNDTIFAGFMVVNDNFIEGLPGNDIKFKSSDKEEFDKVTLANLDLRDGSKLMFNGTTEMDLQNGNFREEIGEDFKPDETYVGQMQHSVCTTDTCITGVWSTIIIEYEE